MLEIEARQVVAVVILSSDLRRPDKGLHRGAGVESGNMVAESRRRSRAGLNDRPVGDEAAQHHRATGLDTLGKNLRLAQEPRRQGLRRDSVEGFDLGAETHAIKDVLVARGRKHLVQPVKLVEKSRRLVLPEAQQFL